MRARPSRVHDPRICNAHCLTPRAPIDTEAQMRLEDEGGPPVPCRLTPQSSHERAQADPHGRRLPRWAGRAHGSEAERKAFAHAKRLINSGRCVLDNSDAWGEHQACAQEENSFIEEHGFAEYSLWYLGIDDDQDPDSKARYKFPYGDFKKVH